MTIRDGIDVTLLRCECGQVLSAELDVRADIAGNLLAVCPNCGNNAPLEKEHEPFATIFERYRLAQLRHLELECLHNEQETAGMPAKEC
jgi:hypothetical protein